MMSQRPTLSLQDIADLARVRRPVVSMWRGRPVIRGQVVAFPQPVKVVDGVERFDRDEIVGYLQRTGRGNNAEASQDAPGVSVPDGAAIEDVVVLLCLYELTGDELAGLDVRRLVELAEGADPDDRLLLREVRALGDAPDLLRYVDDLVEASFGVPDALVRLESGRLAREVAERGLTDDLVELLRAVVATAREYLEDDTAALAPLVDHRLARKLAEGFPGVQIDGDDATARAHRRRAVIDGLDVLDASPAAVRVLSVVGEPDAEALEAVDDLVVSLGPRDVGVALGSAALLTDPLIGEAGQRRAQTLGEGNLAISVRLPRGLWKSAHRQSLALWVVQGGGGFPVLWLADLDAESIVLDDLASDVLAALRHTENRAYRYARRGELTAVLARTAVVPRGVRAQQFGTTEPATHLDRVHTASLITSEPVAGYDVPVVPAVGRLILRRLSLGELAAAGRLVVRRGCRVDRLHADRDGTVPVLAADGSTDNLLLDPFDAARLYPRAIRTEPGDVIFAVRPKPAARVDVTGGALVASPSRLLRLGLGPPIGPHALAAIINETSPDGSEWQTWSVPDLLPDQRDALDAALALAAAHQAELGRRERALHDLVTSLITGVAAGAIEIDPAHHHDQHADRPAVVTTIDEKAG